MSALLLPSSPSPRRISLPPAHFNIFRRSGRSDIAERLEDGEVRPHTLSSHSPVPASGVVRLRTVRNRVQLLVQPASPPPLGPCCPAGTECDSADHQLTSFPLHRSAKCLPSLSPPCPLPLPLLSHDFRPFSRLAIGVQCCRIYRCVVLPTVRSSQFSRSVFQPRLLIFRFLQLLSLSTSCPYRSATLQEAVLVVRGSHCIDLLPS